jgi:hypothetical protein
MKDDHTRPALTRRECLAVGAAGLAASAQPVMAQVLAEPPLRGPPGQRRGNPGFRKLHLDK